MDYQKALKEAIIEKEKYTKMLDEANELISQIKNNISYQERKIEKLKEPARIQELKEMINTFKLIIKKDC